MSINKNYEAYSGIKHIIQAIIDDGGSEYRPRILSGLFEVGIDAINKEGDLYVEK